MSLQTRISALATRMGQEVKTVKTTANRAATVADAAFVLPAGGAVGQILRKTATGMEWVDEPRNYNLGPLALASRTYETAAKAAVKGTKPLKVMVLGDSSNDGFAQPGGPTAVAQVWPAKMAELLRTDLGMAAGGRGFIGASNGNPVNYNYINVELTPAGAGVDDVTWNVGVPRAIWMQSGQTANANKARWTLAAGTTSVDIDTAGYGDTNMLITTANNPTGTTVVTGDGSPFSSYRVTNPGAWVAVAAVNNGFVLLGMMEYKGDETKGIHVRNHSLGGITTGDTLNWMHDAGESLYPTTQKFLPDVVICNFGSNDQDRGWSVPDFRNAVRDLHNRIKLASPNSQVVWILRDGINPDGTEWAGWRDYSNNIPDVVVPLGGHILDMRDDFDGDTYSYVTDHTHYTAAGNAKIANIVKEYLRI